jgi:aerobic carbon-monoxide dehydrogenase small subunit
MKVSLKVNGRAREVDVEPRKTLLDALREDLLLVGSHAGCEHGVCGACTVLIDGEPSRACLMFAVQADGYEITTIEGLSPAPGELSVVQDAFCETHGLQCGYCTPGMILAAHALLEGNDAPSREEIVEAISGNICRCTGYGQIVEAVEFAAQRLQKANVPRKAKGAHPNLPMIDPAANTDAPEQGILEAAASDTPHGGRS